jgi:hypothetical protein
MTRRDEVARLARWLARGDRPTSPLARAWARDAARDDLAALAALSPEEFRDALALAESLGAFYRRTHQRQRGQA